MSTLWKSSDYLDRFVPASVLDLVSALQTQGWVCVERVDVEHARAAWTDLCDGVHMRRSDDDAALREAIDVLNFFFEKVVQIEDSS